MSDSGAYISHDEGREYWRKLQHLKEMEEELYSTLDEHFNEWFNRKTTGFWKWFKSNPRQQCVESWGSENGWKMGKWMKERDEKEHIPLYYLYGSGKLRRLFRCENATSYFLVYGDVTRLREAMIAYEDLIKNLESYKREIVEIGKRI